MTLRVTKKMTEMRLIAHTVSVGENVCRRDFLSWGCKDSSDPRELLPHNRRQKLPPQNLEGKARCGGMLTKKVERGRFLGLTGMLWSAWRILNS